MTGITARRVRFDWADTPLHWVPGDPQTTHTVNVLHLLLPAGERWFCRVFREALPLVTDDTLRSDVKGFIGQESVHARAHDGVLDWLHDEGLDARPFTRRVEWMFEVLLGDRPYGIGPTGPAFVRRAWLRRRLAIIAAIEHFTAVMGGWILAAEPLDRAGADPTMMDLLRWHGAEEVEHRSVAFDLATHLGVSRAGRVVAMLLSFVTMSVLWIGGVVYFMRHDPLRPGPTTWAEFRRAGRQGRLPRFVTMLAAVPRFLAPGFHPSREGSTEVALAYLASSPAAAAAAAR